MMLLGVRMHELDSASSTYHHLLSKVVCNPQHPNCYLGDCKVCLGIESIQQHLLMIFDRNMIDAITSGQLLILKQFNDFVETLLKALHAHSFHCFIAEQTLGSSLVVCADFSENYAFVLQDAAQGFHWNNAHATLHYHRESHSSPVNFVVMYESDRKLISFFKNALSSFQSKSLYNAASQYKIGMQPPVRLSGCCRMALFSNIPWKKGAFDGLGGTVKHIANKSPLTEALWGSNHDTCWTFSVSIFQHPLIIEKYVLCSKKIPWNTIHELSNNSRYSQATLFHTTVTTHCADQKVFS